jgi:phage repressor protein C with HTH and peptisase S24 domain
MASRSEQDAEELDALARALCTLRERANLSQEQAGDKVGFTRQAWSRYETGKNRSLLGSDVQRKLAAAVDSTVEELHAVAARRATTDSVVARGRDQREGVIPVWGHAHGALPGTQIYDVSAVPDEYVDLKELFAAGSDALRIAGESMTPWAEPGELVIFSRRRWPKRGAGCVVETREGEYYVKLYEKQDGSSLFVRQLNPDQVITFPLEKIAGVYAVQMRGA